MQTRWSLLKIRQVEPFISYCLIYLFFYNCELNNSNNTVSFTLIVYFFQKRVLLFKYATCVLQPLQWEHGFKLLHIDKAFFILILVVF